MKASVVRLLSRIRDGAISLSQRIVNFVPTTGRVALLLLLAIMVYRALSDRAILIEPFDVPRELEAKGYTGRILASALIDAVHDFRRSVQSSAQQSEFRSTWNAVEVDFDVEAAGFSSKKLTQIFQYVLGVVPTRLSGEVVHSSEGIRLTVRASNKSHSIQGQLGNVDSMIKEMAPHVVRVSEPYFFGLAVVDTDPKLTLDVVQEVLKANDSRWYPWAYNLWGIVLDKQAKHEEAQEKFKQALRFDGRQDRDARVAALNNLGVSVKQAGRLSAAETHFRDAIQLKRDYAAAHLNLANLLKEQKNYKEAIQHYREAIEAIPSQAELYYRRAEALSQLKDFAGSISDLEFALKLNSNYTDALFDLGLNDCLIKECERASKYFDEYLEKAPSGKFAEKIKYLRLNCPEECLKLRN
jgi:tetratricopeptide (TPR) repeat protein